MANPVPEITPEEARAAGVRVMGTGRSDYPNQINNVLAFPGVFKGALSVRARDINSAMKVAAAHAIADLVSDEERNEDYIIPGAFDARVAQAVADAVAPGRAGIGGGAAVRDIPASAVTAAVKALCVPGQQPAPARCGSRRARRV